MIWLGCVWASTSECQRVAFQELHRLGKDRTSSFRFRGNATELSETRAEVLESFDSVRLEILEGSRPGKMDARIML